MIIGIDDRELVQLIKDTSIAERGVAIFARQVVKSASFGLEKEVKRRMPVDTGRAQASWGHWKSGQLRKGGKKAGKSSEADAVWKEEDGGLAIEQGSNVEYIEYLNRGHSQQAPAGFIDMAALKAEMMIDSALGLIDPLEAEAGIAQINIALDFG
jgi:hypothetical protein